MKPHPNNGVEKRFLISITLTALILVAEIIGGLWTGSLALLSDAAHVFMDIFALGLSFLALRLSSLPADDRHTYGYHRLEVLAALINGATLAVIAVIGLVVNLIVAFVLGGHNHDHDEAAHGREDVNVKSAFLHVVGDAVSSVGVIVAAILIGLTGALWIDPLMSVLIGVIIVISSGRVLKSSLHILVEGVPEGLSLAGIGEALSAVLGVSEVHDLHVWSLCSGHVALSAHVVLSEQTLADSDSIMPGLKAQLLDRFGIEHTTIQFECTGCGQGRVVCQPATLATNVTLPT